MGAHLRVWLASGGHPTTPRLTLRAFDAPVLFVFNRAWYGLQAVPLRECRGQGRHGPFSAQPLPFGHDPPDALDLAQRNRLLLGSELHVFDLLVPYLVLMTIRLPPMSSVIRAWDTRPLGGTRQAYHTPSISHSVVTHPRMPRALSRLIRVGGDG